MIGYKHVQGGNVPGGHNVIWDGVRSPFVTPMRECNSIELRHSDVVVDIGAYVGTYAIRCARFPVKKVIAYEPTPATFELLSLTQLPNMELVQAAVTADDSVSLVPLFLSKGIGVTNSLVPSKAKPESVPVRAVPYEQAVADASIVKIDVEGAEYDYPIIQPSLRAVIIDFHPVVGMAWIARAEVMIDKLLAAGFETVIEPDWGNGWTRAGSWIRDVETSGEYVPMMTGQVCCGCGADIEVAERRAVCENCWDDWSTKHRQGFIKAKTKEKSVTETTQTFKWKGAEELREHLRPLTELHEFPDNPRVGSVTDLMGSLTRFGQVRAILVSKGTPDIKDGTIVAGHHLWKAAARLEWTHIATLEVQFPSEVEAGAYCLADNELHERGHYVPENQMSLGEHVLEESNLDGTGMSPSRLHDMHILERHPAKTERVGTEDLKNHPDNYREHPDDQLEHLTKSLKEHGFYRNIVVAKDGTILAGHGIVEAAKKMGLKNIPVQRLDVEPDSPEAHKVLAGDNELQKIGMLDDRQLTTLLKDVADGDVTNLLGTGYDAQTLANLIMVTRPASEIRTHDDAAEWIGLPGFESTGDDLRIIVLFEDPEKRAEFVSKYELEDCMVRHADAALSWSARWPAREQRDLEALKFESGEESDGAGGEPEQLAGKPVEAVPDPAGAMTQEERILADQLDVPAPAVEPLDEEDIPF